MGNVIGATPEALGTIRRADGSPAGRPGVAYRAGIVNRLRVERAPVVVLSAPPGYGKTTVLAQWSQRDPRPFCWLRLEEGDDDVRQLPSALAATLGIGGPARGVLARVRMALETRTEPLVVVVDGSEQLRSQGSLSLLASLADHLSPSTQLVVCGRHTPALLVGRARAEGRLCELTANDLRLSDREALAALAGAGAELPLGEAREINARAEGWAAGVYLTGLALAAGNGREPRPAGETPGAHHFLTEYFEAEVLSRLQPETARFALQVSLLDRLSGPICDAVAGSAGSGARLGELASAGAFLVPLDPEHTTFRFHRYFREALLSRFRHQEPAEFAACSRRAAAWHEEAGDLPAAIAYLRAIGDRSEATRLLGLLGPDVLCRGLLFPLESSLRDLRDERLLRKHATAAVTAAAAHALLGNAAEVDHWVLGSEGGGAQALLLRALLCRDGLKRMADDARAASRQLPRHSPLHACALFLVGITELLGGDAAAAEQLFREAADRAASDDAPLVESMAVAELSLLAQARELWGAAEQHARRARDLASTLDERHVGTALADVASARSALRNSNWARAGDEIERLHRLLPHLGETLPWLAVQVRIELARAHLALNDTATAAELATEVAGLLLVRPHLGTLRDAAAELQAHIEQVREHGAGRTATLTAAELRLLPLLTTHLSFRQIADHLYVSRNTVKTQAISVYRKLGVSSRTEAIDRAIESGLLRPEGELERKLPAGGADHPKRTML